MARGLFIAFLFAHGLIHLAIWVTSKPSVAKGPFDPTRSWLLGDVHGLAMALALTVAALYAVAGMGLVAEASWWRPLTVAASGISLALMLLTFDRWLLAGIGVDIALLVGLGWYDWPAASTLGA
jgi:hypothetical protein